MFGSSGNEENQDGLMGSTRRLLRIMVQAMQTRVELFSVEFQEEMVRLVRLLIWSSVTVFLAAISLVMATFAVIFAIDDAGLKRIAVIAFSLVYIGAALFAYCRLMALLKGKGLPFAETLNEIRKDSEWLKHQSKRN